MFLKKFCKLHKIGGVFAQRHQTSNLVAEILGKIPVLKLVILLPLPENVVEGVPLILAGDAHVLVVELALGIEGRLLGLEENEPLLGLDLLKLCVCCQSTWNSYFKWKNVNKTRHLLPY